MIPLKQAPTYVRHHSSTPNFSESTRSSTKNNLHQQKYIIKCGLVRLRRGTQVHNQGIDPKIEVYVHIEPNALHWTVECIKKLYTLNIILQWGPAHSNWYSVDCCQMCTFFLTYNKKILLFRIWKGCQAACLHFGHWMLSTYFEVQTGRQIHFK